MRRYKKPKSSHPPHAASKEHSHLPPITKDPSLSSVLRRQVVLKHWPSEKSVPSLLRQMFSSEVTLLAKKLLPEGSALFFSCLVTGSPGHSAGTQADGSSPGLQIPISCFIELLVSAPPPPHRLSHSAVPGSYSGIQVGMRHTPPLPPSGLWRKLLPAGWPET